MNTTDPLDNGFEDFDGAEGVLEPNEDMNYTCKNCGGGISAAEGDDNDGFCESCANDGWQDFYDPGGRSALRAGVREFPCPTCGRENMLTAKDVSLHYQCDICADEAEGGGF